MDVPRLSELNIWLDTRFQFASSVGGAVPNLPWHSGQMLIAESGWSRLPCLVGGTRRPLCPLEPATISLAWSCRPRPSAHYSNRPRSLRRWVAAKDATSCPCRRDVNAIVAQLIIVTDDLLTLSPRHLPSSRSSLSSTLSFCPISQCVIRVQLSDQDWQFWVHYDGFLSTFEYVITV